MERPMKWYKFVVYVQLFLAAILNLVNAVIYCSGLHYGSRSVAEQVYAYYGGMKWIDLLLGICSFACAVLAIVVRQKLKNFKMDGPKWYIILLALELIASLMYIILTYMLTRIMALDASIVTQIAVSAVLIFANKKYFDNRMDLFVN